MEAIGFHLKRSRSNPAKPGDLPTGIVACNSIARGVTVLWRLARGWKRAGTQVAATLACAVNDVTQRQLVDRRSACPGLFRLAPALDGGICRVKLACGRLSADQAEAVAAAAARFSTAPIELTNRANFQIRAVQPKDEDALIDALMSAGLGPQAPAAGAKGDLDQTALLGSDDVRNVMVSPLAGRDPLQVIDVLPLAEQLLASLQGNRRYHALSPKFGIQIDGGEGIAMLHHPHDLWLAISGPSEVMIGLGSCLPLAGDPNTPAGDRALAAAPLDQALALILATLDLFLEISAELQGVFRVKQLPADFSGAAFIDRLQLRLSFALRRDATVAEWRRQKMARGAHLGIIAERAASHVSVGATPALGRITPQQFKALADLARRFSDGQLHLTPWQSVLLPRVEKAQAEHALQELVDLGLVTDANLPFAQMIACTGSAGCGSGLAATQADGARLAAALAKHGSAFPVHLSGCTKSCAAMRAEPATLVGVAPGLYDLYRRAPKAGTRFGQLVATRITIDEAAERLAAFTSTDDFDFTGLS
jgi:precorrin-3B synthase